MLKLVSGSEVVGYLDLPEGRPDVSIGHVVLEGPRAKVRKFLLAERDAEGIPVYREV